MTDERPTHLDLFSGIGGFAIAAREAGFRTVAFCESDARCRSFLEKRYGLPVEPDIRKLDGRRYAGVSLLTGGPPCQPASRAGKQGGAGDDRWLWPEALRVLDEAKPDCVVFENPPGIGDVGLDGILSEMGRLGYEVQVFDIPACAVDSPQLRHRIWIVGFLDNAHKRLRRESEQICAGRQSVAVSDEISAVADTERCGRREQLRIDEASKSFPATQRREGASRSGSSDKNGDVADTERERRQRGSTESRQTEGGQSFSATTGLHSENIVADTDSGRELREGRTSAEPDRERENGRLPHGSYWQNSIWVPCADGKLRRAPDDSFLLVDGLHRSLLGALGNSIVPQVALEILKAVRPLIKMTAKEFRL